MRKVLVLLFISMIVLSACGKTLKEDVSEDMESEVVQILDIMDDAKKGKRLLTDEEQFILDDYIALYEGKSKMEMLSETEEVAHIMIKNMVGMADNLVLKNGESYETQKKMILETIYE